MGSLIQQGLEQTGFFQRAERRPSQGTVVDVDPITHTLTVNVGAQDVSGNPAFLYNVPFQPQTPPSTGDTVTLAYTTTSPHSAYVAMSQLSGQNSQGSITSIGGVQSLQVPSDTTGTKGIITLTPGTGINITRTGADFTFSASGAVSPASTVQPVGSTDVVGSDTTYAREDHAHQGVHSLAVSGGAELFGDVALVAGSNITLTEVTGGVQIAASGGLTGVPVYHNGTLVGTYNSINFIDGSNVTLTVATDGTTSTEADITIASTGAGTIPKRAMWVHFLEAAMPVATGLDYFEFVFPFSPVDGTTSLTWNFRLLNFRIGVSPSSGGPIAINLQSYTGTGVFSGTTVLTSDLQIASGSYETSVGASGCVSGQTSWASGTKMRCNITGVAPGFRFWNVALLLEAS